MAGAESPHYLYSPVDRARATKCTIDSYRNQSESNIYFCDFVSWSLSLCEHVQIFLLPLILAAGGRYMACYDFECRTILLRPVQEREYRV